uniref:Uncharacterized protein n=1 Tax=Physcomitrium patens TaxID=3218 RepID=A0A2K1IUC2_PHYPA|nr:hypothetical protein PHYPA_024800 [Physcomitrium patens]
MHAMLTKHPGSFKLFFSSQCHYTSTSYVVGATAPWPPSFLGLPQLSPPRFTPSLSNPTPPTSCHHQPHPYPCGCARSRHPPCASSPATCDQNCGEPHQHHCPLFSSTRSCNPLPRSSPTHSLPLPAFRPTMVSAASELRRPRPPGCCCVCSRLRASGSLSDSRPSTRCAARSPLSTPSHRRPSLPRPCSVLVICPSTPPPSPRGSLPPAFAPRGVALFSLRGHPPSTSPCATPLPQSNPTPMPLAPETCRSPPATACPARPSTLTRGSRAARISVKASNALVIPPSPSPSPCFSLVLAATPPPSCCSAVASDPLAETSAPSGEVAAAAASEVTAPPAAHRDPPHPCPHPHSHPPPPLSPRSRAHFCSSALRSLLPPPPPPPRCSTSILVVLRPPWILRSPPPPSLPPPHAASLRIPSRLAPLTPRNLHLPAST